VNRFEERWYFEGQGGLGRRRAARRSTRNDSSTADTKPSVSTRSAIASAAARRSSFGLASSANHGARSTVVFGSPNRSRGSPRGAGRRLERNRLIELQLCVFVGLRLEQLRVRLPRVDVFLPGQLATGRDAPRLAASSARVVTKPMRPALTGIPAGSVTVSSGPRVLAIVTTPRATEAAQGHLEQLQELAAVALGIRLLRYAGSPS
jgi:hypothetical protein